MDDSNPEIPDASSGDVLSAPPHAAAALTIDAILDTANAPLTKSPVPSDSEGNELPDDVTQARPSPSEAPPLDDVNEVPPPNVSEHIAIVPGEVRTRKSQFCSYAWL